MTHNEQSPEARQLMVAIVRMEDRIRSTEEAMSNLTLGLLAVPEHDRLYRAIDRRQAALERLTAAWRAL